MHKFFALAFGLVVFLIVVSTFGKSAFGATTFDEADSNSAQPNIIFIFADDWGWGDLGCHDHPLSVELCFVVAGCCGENLLFHRDNFSNARLKTACFT